MKLSSYQKFILLFQAICLLIVIISIFYPFQIKSNVHAGDLGISRMDNGYEYSLIPYTLLLLVVITYYSVFVYGILPLVILSALALGFVQLIRCSIHFQGFIDHNYDTNAGSGFYLFFWSVILHLFGSLSFAIWQRFKKNSLN